MKSIERLINYKDAISYWTHIPPTVDGMLGGFGFISSIDIQGSEQFLKSLFQVSDLSYKHSDRLWPFNLRITIDNCGTTSISLFFKIHNSYTSL